MLSEYLKENKALIEKEIILELSGLSYPEHISEGMKYSIMNGGKRLRPILLLTMLDILKVDRQKGFKSAIALELIHSYSLVHDDLPALDNDDYRRGKLTTHKKFGEAEAILIGDALLTHAFYILSEKNKKYLSPEQIVDIISYTSSYAGVNGMIGGQAMDIDSEGKTIDKETLSYIHENKTGKLLELPFKIACRIANLEGEDREYFLNFAKKLGLAFQIRDDILDIEGSFKELGKTIGKDENSQKATYPSLYGLEESKKILTETLRDCKEILETSLSNYDTKILLSLLTYMEERKN